MLFDAQAALAEILATPCDTRDNRDKPPEKPPLSRVSRVSQAVTPEMEIQPQAQPEPSPAPFGRKETGVSVQLPEPEGFPYGFAVNGYPLTWTGRPVSREVWVHLSPWERHGSTGMLWNGLTLQWEPIGAAPP